MGLLTILKKMKQKEREMRLLMLYPVTSLAGNKVAFKCYSFYNITCVGKIETTRGLYDVKLNNVESWLHAFVVVVCALACCEPAVKNRHLR